MGATIIVDAFWGDAGKGKLCAAYAKRLAAQGSVRAGAGSNAGHSVFLPDGSRVLSRMFPLGWLTTPGPAMIGSGVCVNPILALEEIERWDLGKRALIDFRCPIIRPEDIEAEARDPKLIEICSTQSGSGWARAERVLRRGVTAGQVKELDRYVGDVAEKVNQIASDSELIVEGSQATFLSLYLSDRYPYCTSTNCTTAAFVDQIGLSWRLIQRVVFLIKCLPTSVGPGPLPNEMSPLEIEKKGLQEYGSHTGRPRRRVREIDWDLLRYSAMLNGPTEVVLTHCDQYDDGMRDATDPLQLTARMRSLIDKTEQSLNVPVVALETGKDKDSIMWLF